MKSKDEKSMIGAKLVLLLGANIALMAGASLSPAMPAMLSAFESVPGAAFWVAMIFTLPALFVVLGGPLIGFLTDRFGRKPVLLFSILLGGLGGSSAVFLNAIGPILVSRALVGLSMAGSMTATNALIADYFEGQDRAKFMGLQSAFTGLMGVIFSLVGGLFAELNWHYAFLSYLPLLLLLPLAWITINEPAVAHITKEKLQQDKLKIDIPKIYIYSAIFINQLTFLTIPVYIAYFMTLLLQASAWEIGLVGAVSGMFSFWGGILFQRFIKKTNYLILNLISFLFLGVGFLVLGMAYSWFMVVLGQLIAGFCVGLTVPNLATWLASDVKPGLRGRANGIFVTMLYLGNFLTSLIFTPIINRTSYHFAYLLSAVIIILTGVGGYVLMSLSQTKD
jgi:MFS family permease